MPIIDNRIIFLHIPRTGGNCLLKCLIEHETSHKLPYKLRGKNREIIEEHLTLDEIEKYANINLDNYIKFTFTRNPFDKIVSFWSCWLTNTQINKNANKMNFDEYIEYVKNIVSNKTYLDYKNRIDNKENNDISHFIPQNEMIGNHKMDFIGRFENYENDIKKLEKIIGFDLSNIYISKNKINYRHYYSDKNRKIIEELYADDLKRFNYEF